MTDFEKWWQENAFRVSRDGVSRGMVAKAAWDEAERRLIAMAEDLVNEWEGLEFSAPSAYGGAIAALREFVRRAKEG